MPDDINNLTTGLNDDEAPQLLTIDAEFDVSDLLDYVFSIPLYPRFLLSMRDEDRVVAGCGNAIGLQSIEEVQLILSKCTGTRPSCFVAIPFDRNCKRDEYWQAFNEMQIWIPSLFAEASDSSKRGCITVPFRKMFSERDIGDNMKKIGKALRNLQEPAVDSEIGRAISRIDIPDANGYKDYVKSILASIAEGSLTKAVAARRTDLQFEKPPDAHSVYKSIQRQSDASYSFILQPDDKHTFLGFTPERLFRLENRKVTTEAVAGTAPTDIAKRLLKSEKDRHEHRVVIDYLTDSLFGICSSVRCDDDVTLKRAGAVSHLYSKVEGVLAEERSITDVLNRLHPTPAVCGQPKTDALACIRDSEPFDRGLYAGTIGIIGENQAEMAVAIRSMLVHNTTISLFAGAGIVDGSKPESELAEIESKIRTYLDILGME